MTGDDPTDAHSHSDRVRLLDAAERVRRDAPRGRGVGSGAIDRLGWSAALGGSADRDNDLRAAPAAAPGTGVERIHRAGPVIAAGRGLRGGGRIPAASRAVHDAGHRRRADGRRRTRRAPHPRGAGEHPDPGAAARSRRVPHRAALRPAYRPDAEAPLRRARGGDGQRPRPRRGRVHGRRGGRVRAGLEGRGRATGPARGPPRQVLRHGKPRVLLGRARLGPRGGAAGPVGPAELVSGGAARQRAAVVRWRPRSVAAVRSRGRPARRAGERCAGAARPPTAERVRGPRRRLRPAAVRTHARRPVLPVQPLGAAVPAVRVGIAPARGDVAVREPGDGLLGAAALPAQQAPAFVPAEGDYVIKDFRFASGESLPELRLHYATFGRPAKSAVLILHGTGGSGRQFLRDVFAGVLFGPGQLLDTARYYVILPDGIGHGRSSKPSDGLHARFPHYTYDDMVLLKYPVPTE